MNPGVDTIRGCLDGAVPAVIATCSADGVPNVSYVSEVHYVDRFHVALSYQFFNKTRANVLATGHAVVLVIDSDRGRQFQLTLRYLRTETSGPLFESMRVKLAGIAAHTGMSGVFRLLGSDVYQVIEVVAASRAAELSLAHRVPLLPALRGISGTLAGCDDLESLLDRFLAGLQQGLGVTHAMVFLHDGPGRRLYLIGSAGYAESGVGSEIPMGHGIVGIAAAERTPIRITHLAEEFRYSANLRERVIESGLDCDLETAIPLPGLESPGSQVAVPLVASGRLLGVVHVESREDGAFDYDFEDVLVTLAAQLATAVCLLNHGPESRAPGAGSLPPPAGAEPLHVRYYPSNGSVFVDEDYLIKGVAGSIFWKLVTEFSSKGRNEFTNRELRLDPAIRLPEISENLEARLVLLKRRLAERGGDLSITQTGRGRFRLDVSRPLSLETIDGPGS